MPDIIRKNFRNIIISVLLIVLGGVIGYKVRGGEKVPLVSYAMEKVNLVETDKPAEMKDVKFSQFWEVWQTLDARYLDQEKLDKKKMVEGAIAGMTSALGDPYTLYLPPEDQKRSEEDLQGSFFGVGIQLGYIDNVLAVTTPLKGSPAEKAGIKPKDLILRVKDEASGLDKETAGWTLPEAVEKIRGEKGTKVILTILRRSEKPEPFTVTLERGEILGPSVELSFIDKDSKKYAHITLSRFGDRTQGELEEAIRSIKQQNPKVSGIVLDMRNNPGGYLDGAISVASEFISSGTVVTQKGRYGSQDYKLMW
jgi:carboxyl-terminal processing protease